MSLPRKPGTVEPVIYFQNAEGHLLLAPYSDFPTPAGYERCGADTLPDIDRLQARLVDQERREWEREALHDEQAFADRRKEIRERLYARMSSAATSEYEKEFIRLYLELRQDKRAKYQQRFLERTMYLWAREHDIGSRRADEERWDG